MGYGQWLSLQETYGSDNFSSNGSRDQPSTQGNSSPHSQTHVSADNQKSQERQENGSSINKCQSADEIQCLNILPKEPVFPDRSKLDSEFIADSQRLQ